MARIQDPPNPQPLLIHATEFSGREKSPVMLFLTDDDIKRSMKGAIDAQKAKIPERPKGTA